MASELPAVLITAFNRPDRLAEVLRALAPQAPARLYVSCDGPRPHVAGEAERVGMVRAMLANPPWPCRIEARFLPANGGCGVAMSGALDWFFEREEQGVVLEDDCVPSPDFLPFCAEVLARHAHDERVMSVLGTRHAAENRGQRAAYSYSRLFAPWGWASWRRAWRRYRVDASGWRAEFGAAGLASRGLAPASVRGWSRKLDWAAAGGAAPKAWAYQWNYAHFRHDGLAVLPRTNLISNIGFDAGATHTDRASPWAALPVGRLAWPLAHPVRIEPDHVADTHRERWHMNHRPWLPRKWWQMRNRFGFATPAGARGW
jgi:hypothetical protein